MINKSKRIFWVLCCCLFSLKASAQESQPTSQAQPTSQPASTPTSIPSTLPIKAIDPWSGQEIKLPPVTPGKAKSPRTALALAWLGFGGGVALSISGASNFLGTQAGESRLPAYTLLGLGGALAVVGPSLGHFYARETRYATRKSLLTLGVVSSAVAIAIAAYEIASPLEDQPLRITLALLPVTFAIGYELQYAVRMAEEAPLAVNNYNRKRGGQLTLLPNGLSLRF
jgi:hypothetical protein